MAQLYENYHALTVEYGRVLFERDLAQKTLQIAKIKRGSQGFNQQRNNEIYGTAGISYREEKMHNEQGASEQYQLQRFSKPTKSKPQLLKQTDRCKSDSDKARSLPLVNGNSCCENGHRSQDDDEHEECTNEEISCKSNALVDGDASARRQFGDDDNNDDEGQDGNYGMNCHSSRDVSACHTGDITLPGCRDREFDDDDADSCDDDADHDDDYAHDTDNDDDGVNGEQKNGDDTVENEDNDKGDNRDNGGHNQHHPHHYDYCDGEIYSTDGNDDDVNEKGDNGNFVIDSSRDKNYDDDAGDENDLVIQTSSLPVGNRETGKTTRNVKLSTEDSKFSLPVETGWDKKIVKSQTVMKTAADNNTGKKRPQGARAKTLLTSNLNTSTITATGYSSSISQGIRLKTSSPSLPRGNWVEPDCLYKTRIPSLEATGINQNFLARHTTDKSLQHASQPGNFNHRKKSTSRNDWPVWSLPPPALVSETSDLRQRWPETRGLHPCVVDQQTAAQSNWQFPNQPWREMNYSTFSSQKQKSFNHVDTWFTRGEEASAYLRLSESLPDSTGTEAGNSFNTHSWMSSAYESNARYSASYFDGSQTNSSTYGVSRDELTSRLTGVKSHAPVILSTVTTPEIGLQSASVTSQGVPSDGYSSNASLRNGQERSADPSKFFTGNQDARPLISSEVMTASRVEDQTTGDNISQEALLPGCSQIGLPATDSTDDLSLAALERKMAEACAIVEKVMREREERTKAQREEARKKRERREKREREEKEKREREERERREREERERREREEKEERERREQTENEDTETRRFVGERAPVQESPGWQCEHYQRRCRVKFSCCGIFYPCHRCHNISGACDTDDRKANNATHVKCGNCGHEEQINEGSQYCSNCGERMSAYFCYICKHFTGVEKNPFHCEKCGICRIHRDKSFHCDVCNVCLDKRLEGKHKCRPDSGHDECCICLEDAFSGCQILPCSHKVHKDCAIAMIQNGVRNCPICRHPLFNQDSQ